MFDGLKDRINEESVFFERLRTLLYLSKYRGIEIWVVLLKPHQYIHSARVVSGVVKTIFHGTAASPLHKRYIGGRFSFEDIMSENEYEFHNMQEIWAVSFHPITTIPNDLENGYSMNRIQHLTPFTGFTEGSNTNESRYYRTLFSAISNDAT